MRTTLRWYDTITINIYYTGLTTLSQALTPLILPLLVQQFVGIERQATYYGTIRLWSLMVALLVQSLMGSISDQSTSKWGRRRPFIFIGTIITIFLMVTIGLTAELEGLPGYWILFVLVLLLMVSANTAQAAVQGLIPDIVPEEKRGIFSGVKSLLEVPVPLIIVPFTIGTAIASGDLSGGIAIVCVILAITTTISMFAPERPFVRPSAQIDWKPFLRLFIMTALFAGIILVIGFLIRFASARLGSNSLIGSISFMAIFGLAGMLLAIGLGVYFCVHVGIGTSSKYRGPFTWWVINRLAFLIGSTNIAGFAVFYLQGRLGLDKEAAVGPASRLIMVVGIFVLLLALPGGWLSDRVGKKILVGICGISAAIGTVILVSSNGLPTIYLGGVILGCAVGLFYTSNWALGTLVVPKEEAGRYLGISNLAGAGAGAVGAYIGGPIADFFTTHFPGSPGLGYIIIFAIYGVIFLFSVAALTQIHPRQKSLFANR